MMNRTRPSGIKFLTALHLVLGALLALGGFTLTVVGFALPETFPHLRWFVVGSVLVGTALLFFALIQFLLAYGLWNGMGWAWIASMVFAVLGIISSVLTLYLRPRVWEFVSLILDLLIIYYLMQPRVQAYFGRST